MTRLHRKLLSVLAVSAVVVSSVLPLSAATAADEMTFASWGGAYQDGIREAWMKPFTA